jgi:hypothetical protein
VTEYEFLGRVNQLPRMCLKHIRKGISPTAPNHEIVQRENWRAPEIEIKEEE